jgi:MFS family permease
MSRTSPDKKEKPGQAKTRFGVFAFVIILASLAFAAILLIGPFADPTEGTRPLIVVGVPVLTAAALIAALVWFFIQSRGRR